MGSKKKYKNEKKSSDKPIKIKKRKSKINLVFDEAKRRDFLGGFHKRKLERKKKAQTEFEDKLKEERKRIKLESKESYKKLVVTRRPIPELEELLANEYESEDVTVKVVELSTNDFAEKSNWIGQNKPQSEDEESSDNSDAETSDEELPGMELKEKVSKKIEKEVEETKKPTAKAFKSKRDINKMIKKEATKKVQKSKTFQTKNRMEQLKNKKKSMQMKNQRRKTADKKGKARHRGAKPALD